ncbi:MAG: 3-hydroxyacyl-CoA dehydrogenase family protein [Deltaproteobacteria bacterium]|nr:3-hydroxyacyl-CoA dehydrogenase family protein [Deltaproteobacteria bacterium]
MVLGAGTMGAGIAEVLARAGIEVSLYDVSSELIVRGITGIDRSLAKAVEKGKLSADQAPKIRARIHAASDYEAAAGADLIIEAVPEDMALKKRLFDDLSSRTSTAILATNTSSLSVTELAAATREPSRVIGLHFFNPPPIMPLLEIVVAEQTSDETLTHARVLAAAIEKTAIVVKDSPGFATSRLGIILGMEAIRMLESGVASAEDIDRAMELGYKHPMGPLKLTDLVGLDVRLAIADHLTKEIGPQFTPPPLLRRLVRAGKLGKKSGEGFYRWVNGEAVAKR